MQQVCDGIGYLHKNGILHLDIKPLNMLVHQATNVLKLCDFGNSVQQNGFGKFRALVRFNFTALNSVKYNSIFLLFYFREQLDTQPQKTLVPHSQLQKVMSIQWESQCGSFCSTGFLMMATKMIGSWCTRYIFCYCFAS